MHMHECSSVVWNIICALENTQEVVIIWDSVSKTFHVKMLMTSSKPQTRASQV